MACQLVATAKAPPPVEAPLIRPPVAAPPTQGGSPAPSPPRPAPTQPPPPPEPVCPPLVRRTYVNACGDTIVYWELDIPSGTRGIRVDLRCLTGVYPFDPCSAGLPQL